MSLRIAVVPGDGIGVEVIREATRALGVVAETAGRRIDLTHFEWGAEHYLKTGETLPEGALAMLQDRFDAILLGAMGDPRVPDNRHAAEILLHATPEEARRELFAAFGTLEAAPGGTRLTISADDLDWVARELARLPFDFEIRRPAELRTKLAAHARRLARRANRPQRTR